MQFKRRRQSELKIKDAQNYPINSKERCFISSQFKHFYKIFMFSVDMIRVAEGWRRRG